MKKLISLITCCLVSATACFAATRVLSINKPFKQLSTSAGAAVTYIPSDSKPQVKITGPEDKIKNVKVVLEGSTLKITATKKKNNMFSFSNNLSGVKITLTAPAITEFEASSGSAINCSAALSAAKGEIDIEASSGAAINFTNIRAKELNVEASSGAAINLGGQADFGSLEASSGAAINASALKLKDYEIDQSSGGVINLK